MAEKSIRRVVIIGGGPTGTALGTWLVRSGVQVALFRREQRAPIVIGESLVPAIIPFLRSLGIEDEVASYSTFKPGATFVLNDTDQDLSFRFDEVRKARIAYSYNVPRDRFDASFLAAAERAGVHVLTQPAQLERVGDDGVELRGETREAARAVLGGEPDFIVDASGRNRLIAKLLALRSHEGPRKDTALHAHMKNVPLVVEGNVHTDRMERGWSWRIPLPGKVSVGFVVDAAHIRTFGDSLEEQFDTFLKTEPTIQGWAERAERISPVMKYTNYQLRTERGVGPGWALVGNAFGFVDPVFSSGLLVGLEGARQLADALLDGSPERLEGYERHVLKHLAAWQRVVDYFYDGRLFTLFRVGEVARQTIPGRMLDFHFRKHMPRVFTGEATTKRYSLGLLDFMIQYGLAGNDPQELEVH